MVAFIRKQKEFKTKKEKTAEVKRTGRNQQLNLKFLGCISVENGGF
jgi:hypothetical protein